ncbi:MAG: radical SAM protein [Nitrospirota bacterium]
MTPPSPGYIQLFPTLHCNQQCSFCFNRGITRQPGGLTAAGLEQLVRRIAEAGIPALDILGGEPTLHRDLYGLLGSAVEYGLRVTMSTNGSDPAALRRIRHSFGDSVAIGISLNGEPVSAGLHDFIVAYRPLLKSLYEPRSRLLRQRLRAYAGLAGTTYYLLYRDALTSEDLGRSIPLPRFLDAARSLRKRYAGIDTVYCSGFIPNATDHSLTESARCPAGSAKLSVMPDGSVYPCYLLFRHKEFMLGNILTDDIAGILAHPALDWFRTFAGNRCPDTGCRLFSRCRGGCPAVSLLVCSDLTAPDPRCIRPAIGGGR